jgi:GNAT superfamily N-acetyltransferase
MTLIRIHEEPAPELREVILKGLRAYNESRAGATNMRPLILHLEDEASGEAVGGIAAHTAFGWMFVELLFVPEAMRGRGHGTALMQKAEEIARLRSCNGIWLDTFSFQARGFYERLGYTVFGTLSDYPPGETRFFMSKTL